MIFISGYDSIEEIHRGSLDISYSGIQSTTARPVIIKYFPFDKLTPSHIVQLTYEYEQAKKIESDHVAKVYSCEKVRDQNWNGIMFFIENPPGISLRQYWAAKQIQTRELLDISIQIARGLKEIHRNEIIHSGITPDAIIINTETRNAKIRDFGFNAITAYKTGEIHNPELIKKNLPYISPEQTGRTSRMIDYRSDFYSLGITLYEALTGKPPFPSMDPLEIVHAHIARQPLPPASAANDIPQMVSNIIMKMIAKNSESRYQSAHGLISDLDECLWQLKSFGNISIFSPGRNDIYDKFIIPQKLYGKKNVIEKLVDLFEQARDGSSRLLLVSGQGGIGKSTIIHELHKPVTLHKGYFASGKFHSHDSNIPYSAIIEAFQGLIRQVLSESDERVQAWKSGLLEAVGFNGKIITDIIPDAELLIGKQPGIPESGPEETQNRFKFVLKNFIKLFAGEEHPLALVLEDLQWADSASLNLLKSLAADPGLKHALFIGSYRDDALSDCISLTQWLDDLEISGIAACTLSIPPLHLEDLRELLMDALRCNADDCQALAELINHKTGGNPFFVKQFLRRLHEDGILAHTSAAGWHWDLNRIQKMHATDNVIELMIERISRMREESREILKTAAVIGSRFSPDILSEVCGRPLNDVILDLNESIQNELIVPAPPDYAFSHDRIHESIISIIPGKEKQRLHCHIGDILFSHTGLEDLPERIFTVLEHYNQSLDCITDPAQRWAVVQMNIMAAIKAKLSTAYASAVKYLDHAISLLPGDVWGQDYTTAFLIFLEKAESQYLAGSMGDDEAIFSTLLTRARTDTDRCKIYSLLIVLRTHQSRIDDAIRLGIEACRLFNTKLPPDPGTVSVAMEYLRVKKALGKWTPEDLLNMPPIEDPRILLLMDIMAKITVPAYYSDKNSHRKLLVLVILKMLSITLEHGNTNYSSYAYVIYGAVICPIRGDYAAGYEYGMLGIALNKKFNDPMLTARVYHLFAAMIGFWNRPFNEYIEFFTTAFQTGMASGDFLFTSYAISNIFFHSIRKGKNINSLVLIYETHLNFIKLTRYTEAHHLFNMFYLMVCRLKGTSESAPDSITFDHINSAVTATADTTRYLIDLFYLTGMVSSCMFGEYDKALDLASTIEKNADALFYTVIHIEEFYFYYGLSITGHYDSIPAGHKRHYARILEKSIRKFKTWSDNCPENFLHQYLLLKAEQMRIRGRDMDALQYYGKAIHNAQKNSYVNHEAIICERAAEFHIRHGDTISAKAHVNQSRNCYREWGADAKVRDVEQRFAPYLYQASPSEAAAAARFMNYSSIVHSLQAISSEIITEELLNKLMKIAMENAGADRGFFITVDGISARIVAETTMTDEVRTFVRTTPLIEKKDILVPVINYVMRTKKHLVIHDATDEESLPFYQHLGEDRPLSVLCLPVERQGKLTGILYLENRIVAGAFTADHIEILELLASQSAISLEMAQLYDTLTQEIALHGKAEAALRNSEDRYRMVVESMNEGICVLDELGRIKFANSRFCEMVGFDRDEIITISLDSILTEAGREILKQQLNRRRRGENEPYELELVKKDGRTISTIVSPSPIFDAGGTFSGSFGLFTDITEKKRMEEDLLKASKIESLGVFAGGIAHDFNNLLTAIIGNISLARLNIPQNDTTAVILAEAENASLRAKDLTHQLLTFSRGGAPIKKTASIKKLLRQTIDFALSGSNIVCIYTIQNDLHNAEIDEGQISQVIHNLVINAMQAMKDGGAIEVKARNESIDDRSRLPLKPGHYILIEITDHGTGIPPENQKYIFDPYFTTKVNGSGLGLTVSYSIMKRHEGHISFETEQGKGTAFIIHLPSSKDQVEISETEKQSQLFASGRVLVMDDDEVVLRVAGNMLKHMGISADFATHGEEAIDMYVTSLDSDHPYNLIIMDLTVPGRMGGKETIARLREINPEVKAIVSSGYSNDPVMANFSEYGFTDVVAKPYRIDDLKAVINRVLLSR